MTLYSVDTGINIHHNDFEGRASWGANFADDNDEDLNGHGSHTSGTMAGYQFGVAKKANLVAVKVLGGNGSGSMASVIQGIEWVVNDHLNRKNGSSIANMSLGGSKSRALDRAVNAAVKMGIHFAVAAGNSNQDACDYSPAGAELPVTVAASTIDDTLAWFSNVGRCVNLIAPGHQITSAWIGSNDAVKTLSGTSMASPAVAGVMALLLSEPKNKDLSPKELNQLLLDMSTEGQIKGIDTFASGTPNKLLYNGGDHDNEQLI